MKTNTNEQLFVVVFSKFDAASEDVASGLCIIEAPTEEEAETRVDQELLCAVGFDDDTPVRDRLCEAEEDGYFFFTGAIALDEVLSHKDLGRLVWTCSGSTDPAVGEGGDGREVRESTSIAGTDGPAARGGVPSARRLPGILPRAGK